MRRHRLINYLAPREKGRKKSVRVLFFAVMLLAVVGVLASAVSADVTVVERLDVRLGKAFWTTAALSSDGYQGWIYNQNDPATRWTEAGKLWTVHKDKNDCLLVGGYLADYEASHRIYLRPFAQYTATEGDLRLRVRVHDYLPLGNDGPEMFGIEELSGTIKLSPEWRAGVAGRFLKNSGKPAAVAKGGIVEYQKGRLSGTLRYTGGDRAARDFRGEIQYSFWSR